MASPCFIGDELSAAGWRLAGFQIFIPPCGEAEQVVRQVLAIAPLLVMTGEVAACLPKGFLDQILASLSPPVLVAPGVRQGSSGIDVAARVRAQLGLLS